MSFLKIIFDFYVSYFSSSLGRVALILMGLSLIPLAVEALGIFLEFLRKQNKED